MWRRSSQVRSAIFMIRHKQLLPDAVVKWMEIAKAEPPPISGPARDHVTMRADKITASRHEHERQSYSGQIHLGNPASDERPQQLVEYGVTGSGKFPLEMLSHDAAWPISEQDAASIALDRQSDRCIRLRSYREPTIKRWASLGWDVRGRTKSA